MARIVSRLRLASGLFHGFTLEISLGFVLLIIPYPLCVLGFSFLLFCCRSSVVVAVLDFGLIGIGLVGWISSGRLSFYDHGLDHDLDHHLDLNIELYLALYPSPLV